MGTIGAKFSNQRPAPRTNFDFDGDAKYSSHLNSLVSTMSIFPAKAQRRVISRPTGAPRVRKLIILTCLASIVECTSPAAIAGCAARDALKSRISHGEGSKAMPTPTVQSARDVATWRTIVIGTFSSPLALRNHLDDLGCSVGNLAGEILARPTFALFPHRAEAELLLITPAQLGFTTDTVTLADLYARARQVGIALARPEIGPQLRMQYLDQPLGEFLTIGMEPVKTWDGTPISLAVANGGAGLLLIGQDGRPDAEVPVTSRFVFERPTQSTPGAAIDQAAALVSH